MSVSKTIKIFTLTAYLIQAFVISSFASEYFVSKVIDGDTIELDTGKHVRLLGINTPESMKKNNGKWVFAPEPYALEAKNYVKSLIPDGKVTLEFDKKYRDKYKRLLAYVYNSDGLMINRELIKKGFAAMYTYYPNIKHFSSFRKAQENAVESGKGIWENSLALNQGDAISNIGRFRVIRGTVLSVITSGNKLYINFGTDYKKDFSAFIYSDNLRFFPEIENDPSGFLKGKKVEVRGKISNMNGPRMVLDNPTQIKVYKVR